MKRSIQLMQEHWTTWCKWRKNPTYAGTCKWREESNLCRNIELHDEKQLMCLKEGNPQKNMQKSHSNVCTNIELLTSWYKSIDNLYETESFLEKVESTWVSTQIFITFKKYFKVVFVLSMLLRDWLLGHSKRIFSMKPCFSEIRYMHSPSLQAIRSVEFNDADSIFSTWMRDEFSVNWLGKSSFE